VKIHDLVARPEACAAQARHFRVDVVHREANMIQSELVEIVDMRIW